MIGLLIFAIILAFGAIGFCIAANEDSDAHLVLIGTILLIASEAIISHISYNKGLSDGAYNQLRNKYEVTYVIDKDSCIIDTIINVNKNIDKK